MGCVAVNNCDSRCEWLIRQMTGGIVPLFAICPISELARRLKLYAAMPPGRLQHTGGARHRWMQMNWQAADLIGRNFAPLMDAAFKRAGRIA